MPFTFRLLSVCATGCMLAAAQDSKPQLTARELFYSAASDAPAAKAPQKVPPKAAPKTAPLKTTPAPATQVAVAQQPPPAPAKSQSAPLPGGGRVIQASLQTTAPAPASGTALGLKYTILKRSGNNDMVEVPVDTVFHAGDRIQFSVQTNGPGYLYIVSQGSSGTWKPIFPSPEVEDGNNKVDGWHSYAMPPKSRLVFDQQTGVEKFFIVFSREPEPDLENMVYSLQGKKLQPVAEPKEPAKPKQMVQIASANISQNIDDGTVGRLRMTYARDLIIEPVDDKTPGDKSGKKENAVYVVNPSGSADSRVVADLKLVHQ